MKIRKLVAALPDAEWVSLPDSEVHGVVADSRLVRPGDLFVSIAGSQVDGHRYIADAVRRGAVAVVAEHPVDVPEGTGLVLVPDGRRALSALSAAFWDYPSRKVPLVGITGTNGKTTTAFLVKAIAEAVGVKAGIIGTAGMMLGSEVVEGKSGFTTPEAPTLHRLLATMVARGAGVVAMEVSSHGLEQQRVADCQFDVAVFTNLTHEHLDYHKDMEHYFAAKARLFHMLQPGAAAVINLDDPYGPAMMEEVPPGVRIIPYGFRQEATVRAEGLVHSATGVEYRLITPEGDAWVRSPYLFGTYNVSNAMAAVAAGLALGYGLDAAVQALATAKGAPGRFQLIDMGQDFMVVVDYAHTPDGFEKLLSDVARIRQPGGRIIMVFGSAGHRDHTKRPAMGRIAGEYCDMLVLTEEDPRTEDAMQIAREIASGVDRHGVEIHLIEDRVEAIHFAIGAARKGDIVLITGKGNETDLEVLHPTVWRGDVPAAEDALREAMAASGGTRGR